MFKLVIQDDEGKTTVVPLIRDEITIGRKEGNTIRLIVDIAQIVGQFGIAIAAANTVF